MRRYSDVAACVAHLPSQCRIIWRHTKLPTTCVLFQQIVPRLRWHHHPYNCFLKQMSPSKCCKTQLLLEAGMFLCICLLPYASLTCRHLCQHRVCVQMSMCPEEEQVCNDTLVQNAFCIGMTEQEQRAKQWRRIRRG